MSEFGKPLEITETTIPTFGEGLEAEDIQAEILKHLYTLWFATPQMESVVYWNTVEGTAYGDENNFFGGLFHKDLTPKKSARMLLDLFSKQWHTQENLITNSNGEITFRGFFGTYQATVSDSTVLFELHKGTDNIQELIL